jgi:hypothetical protein
MSSLPDLDPTAIEKRTTLHEKLLDGRIEAELEAQKASAQASLEAQKAQATLDLENAKAEIATTKGKDDRELAAAKEENDADLAAEALERTNELELRSLYHQKIMEVAAASLDRARDSAKFVQTAAAALITAYAALLALVFSAKDKPLPLRGTYAALYLGLAIAFAVAYLAFLKQSKPTDSYRPQFSRSETQLARSSAFIDWVSNAVANRRNALRASVVAFGFGVAFIPAPFVGATGGSSATATASPAPPTIPRDVPLPIADDAARLFKLEVDSYIAAVTESKTKTGEAAGAAVESCTGYVQTFQACAWTTDSGVERAFRRLATLGALFIIGIPLGVTVYEKQSKSAK